MSAQQIGDFMAERAFAANAKTVLRLVNDAIDAACWDALQYGCTVHVYPKSKGCRMRWADHHLSAPYIGIALEEGPIGIVWHPW